MARNSRAAQALGTQLAALGTAVPLVMAHRMARMAAAGTPLSERDRREFSLMSSEKWSAAWQSWDAMAKYALTLNSTATMAVLAFWMPWAFVSKGLPSPEDAFLRLATAGVGPYRRIAVANDRRLSKLKTGRR